MAIFIQIKKGSVVEQPGEALVCSANNWLILGTGNAGEIRKAGGEAVQKECDTIIKKNTSILKVIICMRDTYLFSLYT